MIVMKFGGSSVESTDAIGRVVSIVKTRLEQRPVVVVSAMGKTTNALLDLAAQACSKSNEKFAASYRELYQYHERAIRSLAGSDHDSAKEDVGRLFDELRGSLRQIQHQGRVSARSSDAVVSLGERLSAQILIHALRSNGVLSFLIDARELIVTDGNHTCAAPIYEATYANIRKALALVPADTVIVLPGFIGRSKDGAVTTLGRGGSDLTAALVGAAISAEHIQIWTDVEGILTCDPRIAPIGHQLEELSYDEAEELACCGAKILHPETVRPARDAGIQITVRSSRLPEKRGTLITSTSTDSSGTAKSIACRTGFTQLVVTPGGPRAGENMVTALKNSAPDFTLLTSNDCVRLLVSKPQEALAEIEKLSGIAQVRSEPNWAIVSLVGKGVGWTRDLKCRAASLLAGIGIEAYGCSPVSSTSVRFALPVFELKRAVICLHNLIVPLCAEARICEESVAEDDCGFAAPAHRMA